MSINPEQLLNNELSRILREKHPRWKTNLTSEKTRVLEESAGLRPDILVVHPNGLPVIIETEIEPARTVEVDARSRLGKTLSSGGSKIEQAIAICLPSELSNVDQHELQKTISDTKFRYCVHFDKGAHYKNSRWPADGWIIGDIDELAACIEHTALSENKMAFGMEILEKGISQAAYHLRRDGENAKDMLETIASKLNQKDGVQTSRMAMAILANAFTFHSSIAGNYNIKSFDQLRDDYGLLLKSSIVNEWQHILYNVNYWPIFKIASEIFKPIRDDVSNVIIDRLTELTFQLINIGATSQHDLSGRMFQRLITDRKFLATYYTRPSSATLLAELASYRMKVDWSNKKDVTNVRIADFACGTGALLNAAYSAIATKFRRGGNDDKDIHATMMEQAIIGCDIMPAATHLTASIISSAHPSVPFKKTQIITLPYGQQKDISGQPISIGALDLIADVDVFPIFNTGMQRIRGDQEEERENVSLPHSSFDLVIMNPPFTRPTNSEAESAGVPIPSFAGFSTQIEERHLMSRKLRSMRKPNMAGHGNAGLASNFIDLANIKVKEGGVVALVLPATFASGEAWSSARALFAENYTDILVVSIAHSEAGQTSFSADTSIGEVLIIATKNSKKNKDQLTVDYVNLFSRPESIMEAFVVAQSISQRDTDRTFGTIEIGDGVEVANYVKSTKGFVGAVGIVDTEIVSMMLDLENGELVLPRLDQIFKLPVTALGDIAERGLYYRDIYGPESLKDGTPRGPFDVNPLSSTRVPSFPMLWAHDAKRETKLIVEPDHEGTIRDGQRLRANSIWNKFAGRLCFNNDFGLGSQPLAACLISVDALSGLAWTGIKCHEDKYNLPIVLWANSTIGLMTFWWNGSRQQGGRARLSIKKFPFFPVLDGRKLSLEKQQKIDKFFEEIRSQDLLPANEAFCDPVRQRIDRFLLIEILELPDEVLASLDLIRMKWCCEPSVHGGKKTRPSSPQHQL